MADENSDLFEAMMTQRAIRSIKPDPVPEELIVKLIELATKAPNGSNRQPWAFLVIRDKEQLAKLAVPVRESLAAISQRAQTGGTQSYPVGYEKFQELVDRFEELPVVIYPCAVMAPGADVRNYSGSLYPAIQNLLLAARGMGIGGVLSTQGLSGARQILGLPDNVEPVAMIPIGYPDKDHYGPTTRKPVSEVLHWDRW